MADVLYVVVPCYNEQEVLEDSVQKLSAKLLSLTEENKISDRSRIMLVDDGSKDNTWAITEKLSSENDLIVGLKLAHNKGHQNALLAGLTTAIKAADMTISIDADLQDDINAIDKMVDDYNNGSDIVYGVRSSRKKDSFFKRTTAQGYYKFMKHMGAEIVYNHADFRLMSRRAVEGLQEYKEVNLFLRGIVPLIGYKCSFVEYERGERLAGESKYPFKKMLAFAIDGITSFSIKPIRFITFLGGLVFFVSIIMLIYSFVSKLVFATEAGWSSLMCSIWALGGIQLLSIGVIGEYIGKIYYETKARPKFIIEKNTDKNTK